MKDSRNCKVISKCYFYQTKLKYETKDVKNFLPGMFDGLENHVTKCNLHTAVVGQ